MRKIYGNFFDKKSNYSSILNLETNIILLSISQFTHDTRTY